ncbi:MAG: PIN domain-containing protein [Cyanosarcina radialis HA8281-LM2]|nr:PIN domain-containing protein [Cyanosarcina radialis HA8281-LM2]
MQEFNGKPLVFLDTDVVASYLRGELSSSHLFSSDIIDKVHLAINPIVLQELFFLSETRQHPERLDEIQQEVSLLPLNLEKAEEYLKQAANLRNRIAHSNDVLILSSASDCDYLVTYDRALKNTLSSLSTSKPQVVTPEELISQLTSKV